METLKRRLSFRKKKEHVPECSKPHQWQEDEKKVREGTCSFQVRYLGCIEVFESRGMQVCEEAVKALKATCKGKYQRAILYVSGDALRVVDEISKSMIVDQTIEKVSFCAPDRNHEKGFAYICRDGTTRRWMCHGFLAVKESVSLPKLRLFRRRRTRRNQGERLSHAVGCAFAICLERKQKRDKDTTGGTVQPVTVTYNQDRTSFTRTGSFRQTSITERLTDPQSALVAEPIPVKRVDNPFAVNRPKATPTLLERQGSFRGFSKLQEASSPFKRSVSLRLSDLPSTLKRQNAIVESSAEPTVSNTAIPEVSPTKEEESIAQMCQQLTQGLTALSTEDPFASAPRGGTSQMRTPDHKASPFLHSQSLDTGPFPHTAQHPATIHSQGQQQRVVIHQKSFPAPAPAPVQQTNPWAFTSASGDKRTTEEMWPASRPSPTNPFTSQTSSVVTNGVPFRDDHLPFSSPHRHNQAQFAHSRSHSIDTGELSGGHDWHIQQHRKPTLLEMAHQQRSFQHNGSLSAASVRQTAAPVTSPTSGGWSSSENFGGQSATPGVDPFDVAWAAKTVGSNQNGSTTSNNPFSKTVSKTFEVQL